MRRDRLHTYLICGLLCAASTLSGCAEYKVASNSPARTQRPTGFYGTAKATTAPANENRERALDQFLRGRRPVRPGPRTTGSESELQPAVGSIAQPGGNLDDAFDNPTPAKAAKGRYHRMQRGESLWAVGRRYGVSVEEIVRANELPDPSNIPAGTRIFIPDRVAARGPVAGSVPVEPMAAEPAPASDGGQGVYHVLKQGDSLSGLSSYYGVPAAEIRRWNESEVAQGLPPGSTLFIPGASKPPPAKAARRVPGLPQNTTAQKVVSFRPAAAPPGFLWPVAPNVLSRFGMRSGRPHTGLDIAADTGTPVKASMAGKVIYSGQMNGYGNVVILDHQNGYFTVYAHNSRNLVRSDRQSAPQMVQAGQTIALVGQTGNASRPHVHFEIRRSNDALDPLTLLPRQRPAAVATRGSLQTPRG